MTAAEYRAYLVEQDRRGCVEVRDGEPCGQCSPCRATGELNAMTREHRVEQSGVSNDEARGKR